MAKIIYLSWNPNLKLLYMSWNLYRKFLNDLLQKPNARGTFWNLHIKIDLKINISQSSKSNDILNLNLGKYNGTLYSYADDTVFIFSDYSWQAIYDDANVGKNG